MFGIVSGLGPRATVAFYSALTDRVAHHAQGRLPRLIMYNVATSPHFVNTFVGGKVDDDDPLRLEVRAMLNDAVQHFAHSGVTTVAMACNTLQDELNLLCKSNGLENIGLVEATIKSMVQHNVSKALVLGTASTYGDGLYSRHLQAQGIGYVYPDSEQQDFFETYIHLALEQSITPIARQQFATTVNSIAKAAGADSIVLACTDFTGDLDEQASDLMVFDSLQLLVKACAEHILTRDELFATLPTA